MVTGWLLGLTLMTADAPGVDPDRAVGSALGKGAFPWYDAPRDAVRPVGLPARRDTSKSSSSAGKSSSPREDPARSASRSGGLDFGSAVATAGFVLALLALVGLLAWFWKMYEPAADAEPEVPARKPGGAARTEQLPAGIGRGFDPADAWAEAIRRRDRGDLAGAIVCLFAHQLLTLGRLNLVRLGPGRTARQLLRGVTDAEYRALVAPTLRLFESAYYGHHAPTAEEFAAAWALAETFERRASAGVTR